ncbi:putative serine/threonine-protein kinase iksA OS=Dictyostelium discoideum GN=iksA PE=3 SV=1 [Rhizoctonia solani AG-1 IB]|uniref:Putative serine/threonine-protein kinase iksA n=1 Tax=Thanatephorus cucumeris (strain AG1-IB / isolate 7/3/14) TaxID=1108050 RepID=A0A0B7FDV6_THACB|nr:putative serine/threonine-protein kinase iksA OS=Dictyostelium discoideum GN=iksA PE=3 SV=1 [Rhizoctonia solani AG-1 IB]
MSSRPFSPNQRRPRIASASSTTTIASAASTAALVPRSASATRSSLVSPRRPLSPPSGQSIESLWQPILRASDQIVLYNPASHAINIVPASLNTVSTFSLPFTNATASNSSSVCPYCHRPMDNIPHNYSHDGPHHLYNVPQIEMSPRYFQVLQDVNGGAIAEGAYDPHRPSATTQTSFARFEDASFEDSQSRRWSRVSINSDSDSDDPNGETSRAESLRSLSGSSLASSGVTDTPSNSPTVRVPSAFNERVPPTESARIAEPETSGTNASKPSSGYYTTFFREETRLGMGANGSVFLCQHVLNGIPLGHFAVKKIAVGDSPSYLMEILREVRLHAKLHHRNIITYHHAWLESARFSTFGLAVPTLHVLMQWAELGSLDDLILQRLGVKTADRDPDPSEPPSGEYQTREARIRAFRARAGGGPIHTSGEVRRREARRRAREMKAVHLLSAEEIRSLFGDVAAGLAFLHESSFLHLDLKPGNVLLTLDEGQLIPRAMLSDFGTAQDALQSSRERSGNTGTLEYSAPEALRHNQDGSLRQITSKSDIWSLGMILHKLIYFRLPWKHDEDMSELENEIIGFQGYQASTENIQAFEKRRLPSALCRLLSNMLAIEPVGRPGSDQVLKTIHSRQFDPSPDLGGTNPYHQGIGPLVRRPTPPSRRNESIAASSDASTENLDTLGQESSPHVSSTSGRGRLASDTQARRRSDPVGEISGIAPRLLVLEGPAPAARRVVGFLSNINVSRILSRGFKSALLICKASPYFNYSTILLINLCVPTPPKIAALSFVIALGMLDMWTRRLRWSFALVVLHLVFMWTANREHAPMLCNQVVIAAALSCTALLCL